jgi:sugar phosphate isomerase/epimerase
MSMKKVISISPNKTSFSPLLFSGDLNKGLEYANKFGYDGVEISIGRPEQINLIELKPLLEKYNLQVYGIATGQIYYNDGNSLYSVQEKICLSTIKRLNSIIDVAKELHSMVIIGGVRGKLGQNMNSKQIKLGIKALKEVAEYSNDKDVVILLEPINRYETDIINTLEEGREVISQINLPNLKLLADTFHMNIEEVSFKDSLIKVKDYLGYVHFADSNRLAPGWGHTNFAEIFKTLTKIKYSGPIGIEVLPKPNDYEAAKQGVRFLNKLFDNY